MPVVNWNQGNPFRANYYFLRSIEKYDRSSPTSSNCLLEENSSCLVLVSLNTSVISSPPPGTAPPDTSTPPTVAPVKTPTVSIIASDAVANENLGDTGAFQIILSAPTTKNIRVKFNIQGTATRGKDYTKFPSSVIVPAGNLSAIFEVFPIDDTKKEKIENIKVKLNREKIVGYKIKGQAAASIQIFDND